MDLPQRRRTVFSNWSKGQHEHGRAADSRLRGADCVVEKKNLEKAVRPQKLLAGMEDETLEEQFRVLGDGHPDYKYTD